MNLGYSQIRCNIMLGNTLYDIWTLLQDLYITFLGTIFNMRKQKLLTVNKSIEEMILHLHFYIRRAVQYKFKIFLGNTLYNARLYTFNTIKAWPICSEAFNRRNTLALKEKLGSYVDSVIVKPCPQTTLFYKISIFCNFSLA